MFNAAGEGCRRRLLQHPLPLCLPESLSSPPLNEPLYPLVYSANDTLALHKSDEVQEAIAYC